MGRFAALCVSELADSVSKHCAALKSAGLLESRRGFAALAYGTSHFRQSPRE